MAIQSTSSGVMITGAADINVYRLLVLRQGMKAEMIGMRLTRKGPSCFSVVKKEFGLKGSKESVLAQFEAMLEKVKAERQ